MRRTRVRSAVVRAALLELLRKSSEPATTRDLVTAVYHFTGNDHVGYDHVRQGLRVLASENAVVESADGWRAVKP